MAEESRPLTYQFVNDIEFDEMMTEFEVDVCDTSDITVYNKDVMLVTWLCLFLAL